MSTMTYTSARSRSRICIALYVMAFTSVPGSCCPGTKRLPLLRMCMVEKRNAQMLQMMRRE